MGLQGLEKMGEFNAIMKNQNGGGSTKNVAAKTDDADMDRKEKMQQRKAILMTEREQILAGQLDKLIGSEPIQD